MLTNARSFIEEDIQFDACAAKGYTIWSSGQSKFRTAGGVITSDVIANTLGILRDGAEDYLGSHQTALATIYHRATRIT